LYLAEQLRDGTNLARTCLAGRLLHPIETGRNILNSALLHETCGIVALARTARRVSRCCMIKDASLNNMSTKRHRGARQGTPSIRLIWTRIFALFLFQSYNMIMATGTPCTLCENRSVFYGMVMPMKQSKLPYGLILLAAGQGYSATASCAILARIKNVN
jgi:hypothetical protein